MRWTRQANNWRSKCATSCTEWFGTRTTLRSITMKIATTLKTLTLIGLTSLTLASGVSQADNGFVYYERAPMPRPWAGNAQHANPWMVNPAYQQARIAAEMKERQMQLDRRQDRQMERILNGMENGKLTMREAVDLLREHVDIANMKRQFISDGRLGPRELVILEKRLDEAANRIMIEKKDREIVVQIDRPGDRDRHDDTPRYGDYGRR